MSFLFKLKDAAAKVAEVVRRHVDANKHWRKQGGEAVAAATEVAHAGARSAVDAARNMYLNVRYSRGELQRLQKDIENQGGHYRELLKHSRARDTIVLGGESLATLLVAGTIPAEIQSAYETAYPGLAQTASFEENVRSLEGERLQGLINGVKGKLFEQQYVAYLNDGNLPVGYAASLADSATQVGWDIQIDGPNHELAAVLQAKATDSVSYVTDAIQRYPGIDVVTTDEVYSHLVMSGVSENIANGAISNADLADQLDRAVDAAEFTTDFSPPLFTLAFIAFTSYKSESLTLYEKARAMGDRSGKAYLTYLIGGGIAAVTNIWWLGVLGSVASRYMSDVGLRKMEVLDQLTSTYRANQEIIDRMKRIAAAQQRVAPRAV